MPDVATLLFSLRRLMSKGFSQPVNPAFWVMNIDVEKWRHPLHREHSKKGVRLRAKYPLMKYVLPQWHWATLESLHVLDQLDALNLHGSNVKPTGESLIWLDVGSKNAAYFPGLCAMAHALNPEFNITGVEVDAYQFYEDASTRAGYARGMVEALSPKVRFEEVEFCSWQPTFGDNKAHVVSCFLPFLHQDTHRAWGLPPTVFNPLQQFNAMWQAVAPGGLLFISNLNAEEAHLQRNLIQRWMEHEPNTRIHPIIEIEAHCHPVAFLKTREETRYLWKLRKPVS
jgi:hypothetical protein